MGNGKHLSGEKNENCKNRFVHHTPCTFLFTRGPKDYFYILFKNLSKFFSRKNHYRTLKILSHKFLNFHKNEGVATAIPAGVAKLADFRWRQVFPSSYEFHLIKILYFLR